MQIPKSILRPVESVSASILGRALSGLLLSACVATAACVPRYSNHRGPIAFTSVPLRIATTGDNGSAMHAHVGGLSIGEKKALHATLDSCASEIFAEIVKRHGGLASRLPARGSDIHWAVELREKERYYRGMCDDRPHETWDLSMTVDVNPPKVSIKTHEVICVAPVGGRERTADGFATSDFILGVAEDIARQCAMR